jgi:tetratricopeptide (TPR) repeat protein
LSRYHVNLKLYVLALFGLLLSSCSSPIGNYFSTRYENVMGYFNTYYNTKKTFDDAVTELEKSSQISRDTNYFAAYQPSPTLKTKFGTVIEKASKIIQYYPRSKWVDNAIMMIGKTYYYQNDYDLAQKKFNELIDNFPNSNYVWEAKLLNARTLFNSRKLSEAQSYLNGFLNSALDAGEKDVAVEGYMLSGQTHFDQDEYTKAIDEYKKALGIDGNGYLLSISAFQLARCYELVGENENSNKAYLSVLDYNPGELLRFKALLNYGKTLRDIKKYTASLKNLNDLRDEALTKDQLSQVDLEIANTYNSMDEFDKALDQYQLVDSLYQKTNASAKSFYNRGLMYEYKLFDYTEAKFYYDKAKTEFTQSDITPLAAKKSDAFARYFSYHNDIKKYDSLFYDAVKQDSLKRNKPASQIDSSIRLNDTLHVSQPVISADSFTAKLDTNIADSLTKAKEINHTSSPSMVTDNLLMKVPTGSHDTLVAVTDSLFSSETDVVDDSLGADKNVGVKRNIDSTKTKSITNVAQATSITPDSAMFMILKSQYELATLFLLDLSQPDSAEFWFDLVANSTHKNVFAPRALYALAEIKRLKDDKNGMDSLHDCLVNNFANSEYAVQIKKLRGIEIEYKKSICDELYENGLGLIEKNKPKESLTVFKQVLEKDTSNKVSPKAIYTCGWVYENMLNNNDSAKAFYKLLIDKYPKSIYTSEVVGKVAVSDDTTNLSKYVQVKNIISPQALTPKFSQTDKNSKTSANQKDQSEINDAQDENTDEEVPEPETDPEEPPN